MPNFLDVAAGVVTVPKDGYGTETALNVGPGSLYYKAGSTVSSTSNDGTLTSGSSLSLTGPTSFVAVSQGARLAVLDPSDVTGEPTGFVPSSQVGQAGGVAGLASTLPLDGQDTVFDRTASRLKPKIRYGQIDLAGHSLPVGIAATLAAVQPPGGDHTYPRLMAAQLGCPLYNRAVGGGVMAWQSTRPTDDGACAGYSAIRQLVRRDTRTAAPWAPEAGLVVVHAGINDYTKMTGTAAPFAHALRSIISTYRESGRLEETDASVVFGGTWVTIANSATGNYYGSGSGLKYTITNGSTVTVTVPSGHSGEVALAFAQLGTAVAGGLVTITLDGVANGTLDLRNSAVATDPVSTFRANGAVYRFAGLAAGSHTIVATCSNLAGSLGVCFDYWATIANPPPVVLVPLQHKCGSNPLTINTYSFTETDRATLNAAITAVCAEFTDGMVIPVDLDAGPFAINGDSTCLQDGLHFNEKGHAKVAQTMLAAAQSAPVSMSGQEPYLGVARLPRPHLMGPWLQNSWTDFDASHPSGFTKSADGWVQLEGAIKRTSPVANEIIYTFPTQFFPQAQQAFALPAGNPAATFGTLEVNQSDGTLRYRAGDSAKIDLSGIRFRTNLP